MQSQSSNQKHYHLRLILYYFLALGIYYFLLFLVGSFVELVPSIRSLISVPFDQDGHPDLYILLLPLLATAASATCFALEVWSIGYEKSSWKSVLSSQNNSSLKTDLFYFFMRISGITIAIAVLASFGLYLWLDRLLNETIQLHFLQFVHSDLLQILALLFIYGTAFHLYHWMLHSRWLWPIHRVHHTAEDFNILINYRNHPLDYAIRTVVFDFFGALAGATPTAVMGFTIINSIYQSMVHSRTHWGWKWVDWILITPDTHRLHHSDKPEHEGKNLGVFSFYDRLFGTFVKPEGVDTLGVKEENPFRQSAYWQEVYATTKAFPVSVWQNLKDLLFNKL